MSVSDEYQLPPAVIAALQAERKIEAIRLVREHFGVDLMQAKEIVEIASEHLEDHRVEPGFNPDNSSGNSSSINPMQPESGVGRVVGVIIIGVIVYLWYSFAG